MLLIATSAMVAAQLQCQQISRPERELAETMLENVSKDVHKYYFDAKLQGLDWDALSERPSWKMTRLPICLWQTPKLPRFWNV